MIRVTCPRCTLVWYSNEKKGGRMQLCSDCADALKRNRRWEPVRIDAFLIAAGIFALVDLVFIPSPLCCRAHLASPCASTACFWAPVGCSSSGPC
jgi:hypothetical protein